MRLFADFKMEYQEKFKPEIFTLELAEKWVDELLEANITPDMFSYGRGLSLKQEWAVSRCFDFIKLCQRKFLDELPTSDQAKAWAFAKKWHKHPIVYEVAIRRMTSWDFLNMSSPQHEKTWDKHWQMAVAEYMQGAVFEPAPTTQENRLEQKPNTAPKSVAEAEIAKCMAVLS